VQGAEGSREARRLDGGSWSLVASITEVESGKRVKRAQLEASLAACMLIGADPVVGD
jgi:hypothetical protein